MGDEEKDVVVDIEELKKHVPEGHIGFFGPHLGEYSFKLPSSVVEWDRIHYDEKGIIPKKQVAKKHPEHRPHCFITATSPDLTVMVDGRDTKVFTRNAMKVFEDTGQNVVDNCLIIEINGAHIHIFDKYIYISRAQFDIPLLKKNIFREG